MNNALERTMTRARKRMAANLAKGLEAESDRARQKATRKAKAARRRYREDLAAAEVWDLADLA